MSSLTTKKILLLLLAPLVGACAPIVKDGQPIVADAEMPLQVGQNLGQTMVARDGGLNGVEIFLAPDTPGNGTLFLHLRDDPTTSPDRATASLPIQQVSAPAYYRFEFAPREDSFKQAYYFVVEMEGAGRVKVGAALGETFLDGAMYRNGEAIDAQMVFRLSYEPWGLARGLLRQGMVWLGVSAIAIFLYVLPGLALLTGLWRGADRLSWGEKVGLGAGISIALYPLLLLWTHLFALHLGALYAWFPPLAAFAFLVWHYREAWRSASLANALREWRRSDHFLPDLMYLILIGVILFTRFWVIRSLDVPMWGDSLHHTMIAQLIVDNGGLFDSWAPYAEMQSLTYHFGFHTAVAAFHWVSRAAMPRAVLWVGQIFNVFGALSLYPLAMRVGKSRWAGIGAVLIAGLLAPMPMSYVNWGRYTQLAGQVILPAAVILLWLALESEQFDWRLIALAWIVMGGLALTHYRVLVFAIIFVAAFFLLNVNREKFRALASRIFIVGIGGFILFLPWFIHTLGSGTALIFATQITTPADATPVFIQQYNSIGDLSAFLPVSLWLLMLVSIAYGIWRLEKGIAIVSVWWFLNLLGANPQWLRLPGQGAISNFATFIAAYFPAGILIGGALGWLISNSQFTRKWQSISLTVILCAIGLWGARERIGDVQIAQHALATSVDLRAAEWIRKNTPQDARFLVNSFFAYGDTVIVGSDGGWWLPLTASRQTTLPPINYTSEKGPRVDYREWINALTGAIQKKSVTSPEVLALLHERGVTHVYIGQQQGRVNYNGPFLLKPEELLASAYFYPVYHQDRVWVFELTK